VAIAIYDDDCGFCRWSLALLLSWDRRKELDPLPLGTAKADALLPDLTVEQRNASWHVVLDEQVPPAAAASRRVARFSAGAALAPALRLLPGGRVPAAAFAHFPSATERAYRWVADHRGLLGRFVPARARRWADRVIAAHGGPPAPQ
jgi:predicted DCC family thiol-disulfide oxidoreductase YuxK